MDKRFADMQESINRLDTKIETEVAKIKIQIENDVTKRLNSLTDGYILNHEKQYELERKFT